MMAVCGVPPVARILAGAPARMVKAALVAEEIVLASASSTNWPVWVKVRPVKVASPFASVFCVGSANRQSRRQRDWLEE